MIDFRREYRPLDMHERSRLEALKDRAHLLDAQYEEILRGIVEGRGDLVRDIAIARTHLETSVMFAVKALTA